MKRWWPVSNYYTGIFLNRLRKTTKYPIQSGCSTFWLRFQTGAFRKWNRSASHWIAIFGLTILALQVCEVQTLSAQMRREHKLCHLQFNVNYEVKYASKPVQTQISSKLYYFKKTDISSTNIIQLRFREIKFISSVACT